MGGQNPLQGIVFGQNGQVLDENTLTSRLMDECSSATHGRQLGGCLLGLGPGEIILVALAVIVVIGPDRLPHFMRSAGRMYGQLRRAADEMRRSLVLEADRQDAEDRYQEMRRRRTENKEEEPDVTHAGAVSQSIHEFEPAHEPDATVSEAEINEADTKEESDA